MGKLVLALKNSKGNVVVRKWAKTENGSAQGPIKTGSYHEPAGGE